MEAKNIINTEAKEIYAAPIIKIVEVEVEQGVQMSSPKSDDGPD